MPDDASLDDFLDADDQGADPDEAETERDDEAVDDEAAPADDAATEGATEPAVATYDWTPGGAACAACDETVERRWRDDPGFVCEECKDW